MTMKSWQTAFWPLVIASALLAGCATSSEQTGSLPGDGDDEMIMGGPPWVLPPGEGGGDVASLPPDIAIPLEGLAGSWSGGRLGGKLTSSQRLRMIDITQLALTQTPAGEKVKWTSGDLRGALTPQVRFLGPSNLECREFHQVLRADGQVETGYATACQDGDGTWRLLTE